MVVIPPTTKVVGFLTTKTREDCPGKAREHVVKALEYAGIKIGTEFLPDDDHGLKVGLKVKTVSRGTVMDDWLPEAVRSRRFGVTGKIIKEHDSHGLCYEVLHSDDNTVGYYEPWELDTVV